ncbi:hypothetical protein ACFCY9_09270 [Streptomyces fimicarius]|uniref:hypothetical protein n=1 Tax=Streptomyces griseus TaxID=1911 RepID=UPI0035DFA561
MKRRGIALLAAVVVAAPALVGSASAQAGTRSAQSLSAPGAQTRATPKAARSSAEGSLVTRLKGVPRTFEAGGDWGEFGLVLKNVSDGPVSGFTVDLQVITIFPDPALHPPHMRIQMMSGGSWTDVELESMGSQDVNATLPVRTMVLQPGESTFRMRMKFSGDAPFVDFYLGPQPDEDHATEDVDYWESAELVRRNGPDPEPSADPEPSTAPEPSADPGPGPSADPGSSADPEPGPEPDPSTAPEPSTGPDPSAEPSASAHPLPAPESTGPGTGPSAAGGDGHGASGSAGSGAASPSDSGLAHTGTSSATKWALGAGGALLALGIAFAVVGRRAGRRRVHE